MIFAATIFLGIPLALPRVAHKFGGGKMISLRKFHEKHENWWMIALAIAAVIALLYFAGALSGYVHH